MSLVMMGRYQMIEIFKEQIGSQDINMNGFDIDCYGSDGELFEIKNNTTNLGITINTDASYCSESGAAGWACWINMNTSKGLKRIKQYGELKYCLNSLDAELQAVANAVQLVINHDEFVKNNFKWLVINCDCQAVNKFINNVYTDLKYDSHKFIHQKLYILKKQINKIESRWVQSHTFTNNSRKWVNEWCDTKAKESMRKKRKTVKGK